MTDSVTDFYDQLSGDYHLIFADWKKSVIRQGEALDKVIRTQMGPESLSLLDCSCGIGTQAIGLALKKGYIIRATDLSPKAIERAEEEAKSFGVTITFGVADFRTLEKQIPGLYDVVISCDNSLPHLLTDEDILVALRNMSMKLHQDGLLLLSIRDYDQLLQERPQTTPVSVFDTPEGRHISFQVWDWQDGQKYMIHHFILKQVNRQWDTAERITGYKALKREELTKFLLKTGFSDVTWQMPEQTGYYQPIVTARKKG